MKATEILKEEHQVILRVLTALELAVSKVSAGPIRAGFFLDASDFIKNFADGCHHAKEEGVLFKYMETYGVPVQGGPIGAMLADHEQGRLYNRQMKDAAEWWQNREKASAAELTAYASAYPRQMKDAVEWWQNGFKAAAAEVTANASAYTALLRMHIMKEDNILFPMADRVIPLEIQPEVEEKFESVEREETGEGIHEKYLALADKIEQESINFVTY